MAQDSILVLDCGGADARQIAHAVRGAGVYCEIVDMRAGVGDIAGRNPAGLIALGGTEGACKLPGDLLLSGTPVLALGEAAQALLTAAGGATGEVALENKVPDVSIDGASALFQGIESGMRRIEKAYKITLPEGFSSIASCEGTVLAFASEEKNLYGLQFLLERNDIDGYRILSNFVKDICGCAGDWSLKSYLESAINGMRNRVGDGIAICPMTGGVDTAVCAALAHRALGERAKCVLIDTGLMTLGEGEGIERAFVEQMEVPLLRVQASKRFLTRLSSVTDPDRKREIVADEFGSTLADQGIGLEGREIFLVRGTIYNDVLDNAPSVATGGAPGHWTVLEPLRGLFKREVRELGTMLGVPARIVGRQPFPSAGLAVRCLGEVTPGRIETLRNADAIFKRVVEESGADKGVAQYFAMLAGVGALDSEGDRTGETVVLRAVQARETGRMQAVRLAFDVLETATYTILSEVPGVTRVLYDLTPQPPAAVEME